MHSLSTPVNDPTAAASPTNAEGAGWVQLRDVTLRDGLQMLRSVVPTAVKIAILDALFASGIRFAEVTSLVPRHRFPQFADADEVIAHAKTLPGFSTAVLVPNMRGAERALDAGADRINVVVSASQAHNRANVRRSTEESVDDIDRIVVSSRSVTDRKIEVGAAIATAFGCTLQGTVDPRTVIDLAARLAAIGVSEIGLADTVGYADPRSVEFLCRKVAAEAPGVPVMLHLHDTRGLGLANIAAGLAAGVRRFDAAIAGLGGCPFAPGASGNVALEDVNHLLLSMGYQTGVEPVSLVKVRENVQNAAIGEPLRGHVLTAAPIHADYVPAWRYRSP